MMDYKALICLHLVNCIVLPAISAPIVGERAWVDYHVIVDEEKSTSEATTTSASIVTSKPEIVYCSVRPLERVMQVTGFVLTLISLAYLIWQVARKVWRGLHGRTGCNDNQQQQQQPLQPQQQGQDDQYDFNDIFDLNDYLED